jgi:pimeloyl-ACP methyl ester carboxylesterase
MPAPDTIVLIHGLWMTPRSWEGWARRLEDRGYRVLTPSWPGMEGDVETLRRDASPIAHQDVTSIVDHYERIIRELERPPIVMGHSFGGGFVQILLDRGLGAAGVAIDAAPTKGVLRLPLSTLRSASGILRSPLNRHKAVPISAKQFRYAFGNTLTEEESNAAHERYAVPGAGHVLFEGALANVSPHSAFRVDYTRDRAPLLFITGGSDHVVPAAVNRDNARKYARSAAITEVKEFPGRPHFTVGAPGWEEVADYAVEWAGRTTAAYAAA